VKIDEFERMLARAGYALKKAYRSADGATRRVYLRARGGPLVNVEIVRGEIDEYDAIKVEAILDEEGFFKSE
jgi:hypothetical protein